MIVQDARQRCPEAVSPLRCAAWHVRRCCSCYTVTAALSVWQRLVYDDYMQAVAVVCVQCETLSKQQRVSMLHVGICICC